jgi:hypothetical protein
MVSKLPASNGFVPATIPAEITAAGADGDDRKPGPGETRPVVRWRLGRGLPSASAIVTQRHCGRRRVGLREVTADGGAIPRIAEDDREYAGGRTARSGVPGASQWRPPSLECRTLARAPPTGRDHGVAWVGCGDALAAGGEVCLARRGGWHAISREGLPAPAAARHRLQPETPVHRTHIARPRW